MSAREAPMEAALPPAVPAEQISQPTMECQGRSVSGLPGQPAFLATGNPRLRCAGYPREPSLPVIPLLEHCLHPADLRERIGFAAMQSPHIAVLALRSACAHFRHKSPDIEVNHLKPERGGRRDARNSSSPLARPG